MKCIRYAILGSISLITVGLAAVELPDDRAYVSGSSPGQPPLAYAISTTPTDFAIAVRVAAVPGSRGVPAITIATEYAGSVTRQTLAATSVQTVAGQHIATMQVPRKASTTAASLRLAFDVAWPGLGTVDPIRHEHYLVTTGTAPHSGLPQEASGWTAIDLNEHNQLVADRLAAITLDVEQPIDGRMSLVIEDADGRRLRNLVSGIDAAKGRQSIRWDGRDEDGNLVAPGSYRWRSIHHPGLQADYQMSFANGRYAQPRPFGTNHGVFADACSNDQRLFVASAITEGGYALIAYDREMQWKKGYSELLGAGYDAIAVAADDTILYAINEGTSYKAKPNEDGMLDERINVTRFDIESGKPIAFGQDQFLAIDSFLGKKGDPAQLRGATLMDGVLYVATRSAGGILRIDPSTGKRLGVIPISDVGPVRHADKHLYVVSGDRLLRLEADGSKPQTIAQRKGHALKGLAVTKDGISYLADSDDSRIVAYDAKGKELRQFGTGNGPYQGTYIPSNLIQPTGMALWQNSLWVTENRRNPKRFLSFDLTSGQVDDIRYGNPPYGGSGCGNDYADPKRWIGMRSLWSIDQIEKTETVTSVLQTESGHFGGYYNWAYNYRFVHQGGRTFVIGAGFIQTISELQSDGSLKDLAAFATYESWRYGCGWKPPQALTDAMTKLGLPDDRASVQAQKYSGVLWIDGNGDGQCQVDEFEILADGYRFAGSRWGYQFQDLTITMVASTAEDQPRAFTLKPKGFGAHGQPLYPSLREAVTNGKVLTGYPLSQKSGSLRSESAIDHQGRMIINSDPWMCGFDADGQLRWRYPNQWTNVHGSHKAPLPERGVMQGCLFFLGCVSLDEQSDVVILNGNHGRFFVLTTDGFYLDELFRDTRMGGARDDQLVGGESFGGSFTRSTDGTYQLQTGGDGYRIYHLLGLESLTRSSGTVTITADQIAAAERSGIRAAASDVAREITFHRVSKAPTIDGNLKDWPSTLDAEWGRTGLSASTLRMAYDDQNLYLAYRVQDESPWRNTGTDWTSLFKTGDSVDLQLGLDAKADTQRKGPIVGDIRLLIAPFSEGNIAVLYRHRLPKAEAHPVTFTSPWRSETVDAVDRIDQAVIAVRPQGNWYELEASIPLTALGWKPQQGNVHGCDAGVIFGDNDGTMNLLRSYWSNQATGLINDVPGEIMLTPSLWGSLSVAGVAP